jgi:hypothetical protein
MPLLDEWQDLPFGQAAEPGWADTFTERLSRGTARAWVERGALAPYVAQQEALTNNVNAETLAREASYDALIDRIRKLSGEVLDNPERGAYTAEARRRMRDETQSGIRGANDAWDLTAGRRREFEDRVRRIADSRPDVADAIAETRIIAAPEMLARNAAMETEARSQGTSTAGGLLAGLQGGMTASFRDPLQVAALGLGGGVSSARTVAGRIAQTVMREAAYNAGAVAVAQPTVQDWRARSGFEAGLSPALDNIGMAALLGGIVGGGISGLTEGVRALRRISPADQAAVLKTLDGTATPGEARQALDAAGATRTPETERALATLERVDEIDRALVRPPEGVSPVIHDEAMAAALRYAEDPELHAPPDIVLRAGKGVNDTSALVAIGEAVAADRARAARPDLFAQIAELDGRVDMARNALTGLADARAAAPPPIAAPRLAELQEQLKAFTGKRRSAPAAIALRTEISALEASVEAQRVDQAARWATQEQALRLNLNEQQMRRAALGPQVREVFDALDPVAKDWRRAVEVLRSDPQLIESALSSADPAMVKAGRLAALGDAVWARVANGDILPDVAVHIVGRTLNEAEQAALAEVLRIARPTGVAETRQLLADATAVMHARDSAALLQGRVPGEVDTLAPRPGPAEPATVVRVDAPAGDGQAAPGVLPPRPDLIAAPVPGNVLQARAVLRDDGTVAMVSASDLARAGEREAFHGDLVASCKV